LSLEVRTSKRLTLGLSYTRLEFNPFVESIEKWLVRVCGFNEKFKENE